MKIKAPFELLPNRSQRRNEIVLVLVTPFTKSDQTRQRDDVLITAARAIEPRAVKRTERRVEGGEKKREERSGRGREGNERRDREREFE